MEGLLYLVRPHRVLLGFNIVGDFKSKPTIIYCFKNLRALMNYAKSTLYPIHGTTNGQKR